MAQFIQGESFGGRLGTALGTGIGTGLQQLAQQKLQQLAQRQQGAFWEQLGLPSSIGNLDPGVQRALLDRLEGISLGGQQTAGIPALQQMAQQPGQELPQIPQGIEQVQQQAAVTQPKAGAGITLGPSSAERRHRETLEVAKEKVKQRESEAEQRRIENAFKVTQKEREQYLNEKRQARSDLKELNFMKELNESGKLIDPARYSILKSLHLDVPALLQSPESEAYINATKNFIANARQVFGGRVTNFELEQFLKTIPTLENTKEGRKIIIDKMELLARAKEATYSAYQKVLADPKNKGIPPLDLGDQVEAIAGKQIDKMGKKFLRGYAQHEYENLTDVPREGLTVGKSYVEDESGKKLYWNGKDFA